MPNTPFKPGISANLLDILRRTSAAVVMELDRQIHPGFCGRTASSRNQTARRTAGNLIWAEFIHMTSRQANPRRSTIDMD